MTDTFSFVSIRDRIVRAKKKHVFTSYYGTAYVCTFERGDIVM